MGPAVYSRDGRTQSSEMRDLKSHRRGNSHSPGHRQTPFTLDPDSKCLGRQNI
ncbi:hypothetical protein I79_000841 [Cricetulus griseus]|uniref:Uncharacterized protein n=1 Tax=Cricetulus griseus TaxID=10029 RepID=G3GT67_CRIGR|nr:hypothetical protein I79_000841 [Cricetulus griseus]